MIDGSFTCTPLTICLDCIFFIMTSFKLKDSALSCCWLTVNLLDIPDKFKLGRLLLEIRLYLAISCSWGICEFDLLWYILIKSSLLKF